MKKIVILLGYFLVFVLDYAEAQNYDIGGNFVFAQANSNAKEGTGFDFYFDYRMENLSIRTSLGKYTSNTKVDWLSEGSYGLTWIEETGVIRASTDKFQPYGGIGIGYYITEHELSSRLEELLDYLGYRGKEDIEDVFGINLRGGLDINLSSKVFLNIDAKYIFLKPKATATLTSLTTFRSTSSSKEIDLNTLFLSFGLTVLF